MSAEGVQYTYDSLNRLIAAATTDSTCGQAFTYDGFGSRTGATVTKGTASSVSWLVSAAGLRNSARQHEHAARQPVSTAHMSSDWRRNRRRAGDCLHRYRKSHSIELGDALIAFAASLNRATLSTRKRKHYPMKESPFF
jgi:hypothetical protein